jgi:hypothetical protein
LRFGDEHLFERAKSVPVDVEKLQRDIVQGDAEQTLRGPSSILRAMLAAEVATLTSAGSVLQLHGSHTVVYSGAHGLYVGSTAI